MSGTPARTRIRHAATLASVLACGAVPAAWGCGPHSFPLAPWREYRIAQDARERAFIATTAAQADLIAIVEVLASGAPEGADAGPGADAPVRLRVERTLKGHADDVVTATWHDAAARRLAARQREDAAHDRITLPGCWPEDDFDQVPFAGAEGHRFLAYLREGHVLRASPLQVGPPPIDAEAELQMLALQVH